MPWHTITDSFDADFGVNERHGHNVFFRDGERVFRTYFINNRVDEAMGSTWSYLDMRPGIRTTWEWAVAKPGPFASSRGPTQSKNRRIQSEGKAPVPTQKPASDLRFFLYVRVTVYSFPSFMRSSYSPVEHGRSSRTNEAFTKADR
jgi:hypothetical protein